VHVFGHHYAEGLQSCRFSCSGHLLHCTGSHVEFRSTSHCTTPIPVANVQVTILEVQLATLNAEVLAMDMETLKARQEELDTAALLTELHSIKNELAALLALMSISPEVNNR
jgi:hypothetical protein